MDEVIANQHVQVLIPPDGGASGKQRQGWTGGRYTLDAIRARLRARRAAVSKTQTDDRAGIRSHPPQPRCHTVPPKRQNAVRTEWRLLMMTHNLTKLHRHHIATAGA